MESDVHKKFAKDILKRSVMKIWPLLD